MSHHRSTSNVPRTGWRTPHPVRAGEGRLNVALYPYVPRPWQFEAVLNAAWRRCRPEVSLQFVDYDCYHQDPPEALDVFVFDTLFLPAFAEAGYLMALPPGQLEEPDDFLAYANAGCRWSERCLAWPYLGCADVIFHREGDTAVAKARTLEQLFDVLACSAKPTQALPAPGAGLLIDLTGRTTDACLYLQAREALEPARRSDRPPLPRCLDTTTLAPLRLLAHMAGPGHASHDDAGSQRVQWFAGGRGRAMINVTETLCSMPAGLLPTLDFQPMPQAAGTSLPPLYVDAVGVNAGIAAERLDDAVALARLMCSRDVMLCSMRPDRRGAPPQYLLPARASVLAGLSNEAPAYARMADRLPLHVANSFRIASDAREWIAGMASAIRTQLLNVCPAFPVHDAMFDDAEPLPADKWQPAHLFRRK